MLGAKNHKWAWNFFRGGVGVGGIKYGCSKLYKYGKVSFLVFIHFADTCM